MELHYSQFNHLTPLKDGGTLLYNFLSGEKMKLDEFSLTFFNHVLEKGGEHPYLQLFKKKGFLADYDEVAFLRVRARAMLGNGRQMSMTICPTMACNLRCVYCYEKNGGVSSSSMSETVQSALLAMTETSLREQGCRELNVTWFGGEPLLRMDIIEHLSAGFLDICERLGVDYRASIITNGTLLTPGTADRLYALEVRRAQITVDGPREIHDKSRRALDGSSSFDAVTANLRAMTVPLHIDLRCNLHKGNADALPEIEKLAEELQENSAAEIRLYTHGMTADAGDTASKALELPQTQFSAGGRPVDENMLTRRGMACGRSGVYSLTIDSGGYLYMCEWEVGHSERAYGNVTDARNGIGGFTLSAKANREILSRWMELAFPEDGECMDCAVLPVCMGGCPYERLRGRKRCNRAKFDPDAYVRTVCGCE